MSSQNKHLWLIRHAESTHNAKQPNEPDSKFFNCGLTEKGKLQAQTLHGPVDLLLCSPLRRTLSTYVHSNLHVKKMETMEELREWTGWGESCMYELENPKHGESWLQFQERVKHAIALIKSKPQTRIAIISHGGTLGEIARQLKLPVQTGWANAEVRSFANVSFP